MKKLPYISAMGILSLLTAIPVKAQKKVSELTLVYDYSIGLEGNEPKEPGGNESTIHTIYIKGSKSRSEMTNALFSSTTLYDASTGFAVILKEVSGQKLLIRLNPENWREKNSQYQGIQYKDTAGTKDIAGYKCNLAVGMTQSA